MVYLKSAKSKEQWPTCKVNEPESSDSTHTYTKYICMHILGDWLALHWWFIISWQPGVIAVVSAFSSGLHPAQE